MLIGLEGVDKSESRVDQTRGLPDVDEESRVLLS